MKRSYDGGSKASEHPVAVLADRYYQDVELEPVIVCDIKDKKDTTRLIRELTSKFPLQSLQHLKRVRKLKTAEGSKLQIILCCYNNDCRDSSGNISALSKICESMDINVASLSEPFLAHVPKNHPLTRKQYELSILHWPTAFHEDKKIAKVLNNQLFSLAEIESIQKCMGEAVRMSKMGEQIVDEKVGAIVVNPSTNQIIAKSHDLRTQHPLQHAVMVCIDLVGRVQGGGAWHYNSNPNFSSSSLNDLGLEAGTRDKEAHINSEEKAFQYKTNIPPTMYTDQPEVKTEKDTEILAENQIRLNTNLKEQVPKKDEKMEPYLCTGYELYVTREPCIMCAMALVHSRISRVFYLNATEWGALGSKYKVHVQSGLNHHFEVYKVMLPRER